MKTSLLKLRYRRQPQPRAVVPVVRVVVDMGRHPVITTEMELARLRAAEAGGKYPAHGSELKKAIGFLALAQYRQ
jgi:hypothetical protein